MEHSENIKNIVFDLGGVLFTRDKAKCGAELHDFFDFIRSEQLPDFWVEYDRGAKTLAEVTKLLAQHKGVSDERAAEFLRRSIVLQQPVEPVERLIGELKKAGYKLYVLSNMSREFIAFLRTFAVYARFDGEVVSCEEGTVKPEPAIFEILLDRFGLDPAQTLFIDDRAVNLRAAEAFGIRTQLFDDKNPAASCALLRSRLKIES